MKKKIREYFKEFHKEYISWFHLIYIYLGLILVTVFIVSFICYLLGV